MDIKKTIKTSYVVARISSKGSSVEYLDRYELNWNRDNDGVFRIWKTRWSNEYFSKNDTTYKMAQDILNAVLKYDNEKSFEYFVLEVETKIDIVARKIPIE